MSYKGYDERIASFDILRFILIAHVFVLHTVFPVLMNAKFVNAMAYMGTPVITFFMLSGFLITKVSLVDKGNGHGLRHFYKKRFARIIPAYVLSLLAILFVYPYVIALLAENKQQCVEMVSQCSTPWAAWCFCFNQYLLGHSSPYGQIDLHMIGHMWSLSVEEQFYFVWPALLFSGLSRKRLQQILVWIVLPISVISVMYYNQVDPFGIYIGSLPSTAALAIGALGAFHEEYLRKHLLPLIAVPVLVFAHVFFLITSHEDAFYQPRNYFGWLVAAAAMILFFLRVVEPITYRLSFLRGKTIGQFGAMTYGFYLYHQPVFYVMNKTFNPGLALSCVMVLVTVAIAFLSYHFVEAPCINFVKNRIKTPSKVLTVAGLATQPA
jgi:peptidoglycan/LPS O-acetylase OafA/YrhL